MLTTITTFLFAVSNFGLAGEAGGPSWDNEAYENNVNSRVKITKLLSLGALPPPRYEVTWDPIFEEAWDTLADANGFDIRQASMLMPDNFYYTRWMTQLFPYVYYPLADYLLERGEYYAGPGHNSGLMVLFRFLGTLVAMPVRLHIEAVPSGPDEWEFVGRYFYQDGSQRTMRSMSYYNSNTGRIGANGGFGGMGFNYNVHQNLLYTEEDSFQKSLGYMKLYDDMFLMTKRMTNIDTVRVKFEYDDRDWMLQLWKGRYFNMPGAEIGIYVKPKGRPFNSIMEFYDTVEREDYIGMDLRLSAIADGEPDELFYLPLRYHWWYAGFSAYPTTPAGKDQLFESTVVPKDAGMYEAMLAALEKEAEKGEFSFDPLDTTDLGLPGFFISW